MFPTASTHNRQNIILRWLSVLRWQYWKMFSLWTIRWSLRDKIVLTWQIRNGLAKVLNLITIFMDFRLDQLSWHFLNFKLYKFKGYTFLAQLWLYLILYSTLSNLFCYITFGWTMFGINSIFELTLSSFLLNIVYIIRNHCNEQNWTF